jgi:hypothetical protein
MDLALLQVVQFDVGQLEPCLHLNPHGNSTYQSRSQGHNDWMVRFEALKAGILVQPDTSSALIWMDLSFCPVLQFDLGQLGPFLHLVLIWNSAFQSCTSQGRNENQTLVLS